MKSYVAVVERRTTQFVVTFPDLPGWASEGATIEEARSNARTALAKRLQELIEGGGAIPAPSSLPDIVADPRWSRANVEAILLGVRPVAKKSD